MLTLHSNQSTHINFSPQLIPCYLTSVSLLTHNTHKIHQIALWEGGTWHSQIHLYNHIFWYSTWYTYLHIKFHTFVTWALHNA